MSKESVKRFPKSPYGQVKPTKVLKLVHSDVIGPIETKSREG